MDAGANVIDESMKRIDESTKRIDESTKRIDETTKRIDETTKRVESAKRIDETTKRIDETTKRIDETTKAYSDHGAYGSYLVKLADGVADKNPLLIQGVISIRVLPNGELNLVTDEGRWFLFAKDAWKSASPAQLLPGGCRFCGQRP